MKQERLTALADGIFAIAMTLLVLTIVVPQISPENVSNRSLWQSLLNIKVSFFSHILSFALLFTYWNAHHFIISIYAKNINFKLTALNAVFLLLISLVPFSTYFFGLYSFTQIAIFIYGLHIILISFVLYIMKRYVIKSKNIESVLSYRDIYHGNIRLFLPIIFSTLAILLSFNPKISLALFAFVIIFNLIPGSTDIIAWFFKKD